jgi:pimeloyl-ACP methyl ester carboxylesterase
MLQSSTATLNYHDSFIVFIFFLRYSVGRTKWLFTLTLSIIFIHIAFFQDTFDMNLNSPSSQRRRVLLTPQSDVTLDVIVDGKDGLSPVVLLPSFIRDSNDFDDVVDRIANAGYLVLRPQPRGMNASCGPLQNLTLHVLADDVAATIRELGNGHRAVIVGHAFGHSVARVTDLDHPQLVRGIVIAAGQQQHQNNSSLIASLDHASNKNLLQDERLKHLYHAFFAPSNDASVWFTGWHPALRTIYYNAAMIPPKNEWWPVSHTPILDLQAAEDPWRPPQSRNELKDTLGSVVTVQVIERASHALFPEQPEKVADAIVNWILTLNSK